MSIIKIEGGEGGAFNGGRNFMEEGKILVRGICQTFDLIRKFP